ncbi:hypothetical protein Tco_1406448 [Tanacetum coccineum]
MVKLTMIARVTDGLPLAEGMDDGRDIAPNNNCCRTSINSKLRPCLRTFREDTMKRLECLLKPALTCSKVSKMSSRLTSESRIYADKARDLNRQCFKLACLVRKYARLQLFLVVVTLSSGSETRLVILRIHLLDSNVYCAEVNCSGNTF